MPFDGFTMKRTVEEISPQIIGMNVRNIYLAGNTIYFSFDAGDLKVSLNPNFSYISLVNHYAADFEKNSFVEFLRSRIRGAKVLSFSNMGYERTAILALKKIDEIGASHVYNIYFDIMGKHSNAIIVENNIILDAYKKIETRVRKILPGEPFTMYLSNKTTIDDIVSPDTLMFALQKGEYHEYKAKKLIEAVYSNIQGFSKITAQELLYRANLDNVPVDDLKESDFQQLFSALLSVREEVKSNTLWLFYEEGQLADLSTIKLNIYSDAKSCSNAISCINEYFHFVENKDKLLQKKNQLSSVVKSKIEQYSAILDTFEKEMAECLEAEKFRKFGELLKAYFYQVENGVESVELYDWEQGNTVTVHLEKNLTPIENSMRYFNIYSKLKRKLAGLNERKKILEKELAYLYQLQLTIESVEKIEELFEIENEMLENGLLKNQIKNLSKKSKRINENIQPSEPRKYFYNGFIIYVGKNNRQNDELVRKASDKDIWLHAQDMPGAHVIIKTNGKAVDEETIIYAARLAATYSKGKYSSEVLVDYTLAKYVKKPKGFKPGLVLYSNFKTVLAAPFQEKSL